MGKKVTLHDSKKDLPLTFSTILQNISMEESDGCQYDSVVISDTKNVSLDRSARLCGLFHEQDPTSLQKR